MNNSGGEEEQHFWRKGKKGNCEGKCSPTQRGWLNMAVRLPLLFQARSLSVCSEPALNWGFEPWPCTPSRTPDRCTGTNLCYIRAEWVRTDLNKGSVADRCFSKLLGIDHEVLPVEPTAIKQSLGAFFLLSSALGQFLCFAIGLE